jgi:hypothetical protein
MATDSQPLYGVVELAKRAGVKPRTLTGYLSRGQCPAPDVRLACGPVWFEETVDAWIAQRDGRLEAVIEHGDAEYERELSAHAQWVIVQSWGGTNTRARQSETAKRNVHNGRLAKMNARTGATVRKGRGFVPTVREEARQVAERMIEAGDVPVLEMNPAALDRRAWAVRMMERRQANRTGADDGIPF